LTTWDPAQYLQFREARLRPALDLLTWIQPVDPPSLVVDLGCGPGDLTARLAERWPDAQVVGVDSSPSMLAEARRDHPEITWVEADLAAYAPPRRAEVVFTNAALHWLPDHERLLPALLDRATPGGVLAVQVPDDWDSPSHTAAFALAASARWRDRLDVDLPAHPLLTPEQYLDLLLPSAAEVDCWTTTYHHVLEGADPVVEWFKGSFLREFLSRLDGPSGQEFLADYTAAMRTAYPRRPDGRTVLAFRRLFLVARARS
jgi:trans-aconitate 2-methyltransferase